MTRVDRFLEMLVRFAEDNVGVGVPLTLTVGGLLVSGTIISQKRYFDLFADGFRQGLPAKFDTETRDQMTANFAAWGQLTDPEADQASTSQDAEGKKRRAVDFIHLGNVQFFHPAARTPFLPGNVAACWRGRCDAIEGFFLGALAITD